MKTKDLNNLVNKIYKICNFKKTGLHEPVFSQEEIKSLKKVFKALWYQPQEGWLISLKKN